MWIIKFFNSVTDMKAERNALRVEAYPELRSFCQRQGLEFVVIDMCGPLLYSADSHFWMDEVNKCKSHSLGPFIVVSKIITFALEQNVLTCTYYCYILG